MTNAMEEYDVNVSKHIRVASTTASFGKNDHRRLDALGAFRMRVGWCLPRALRFYDPRWMDT
jgi:hypothetical protein